MSNPAIDRWYQVGIDNGALGGKLVGAGSGGFLLFYTRDTDRLRAAMSAESLSEVRFQFDHDGSVRSGPRLTDAMRRSGGRARSPNAPAH